MAQLVESTGTVADKRHRRRNRILLPILIIAIIAVTALGILYWLNDDDGVVVFSSDTGKAVPHFNYSIDNLNQPVAVAASPLGDRVFVAEGGGERLIRIFDGSGIELRAIKLRALPLEQRAPDAMAVGIDSSLYVVDSILHRIEVYSLEGEFIRTFVPNNDPDFEWIPTNITFDSMGNLYITDQTRNRHGVMVFNPSGNLILNFGISGTAPGMFLLPTGIVVDDSGRIFVADSGNSRIQVFDPDGQFITAIYGTDMSLPRSMIMDTEGRLHVLDSLGHSVPVIQVTDPPEIEFRYTSLGHEYGQIYFASDMARDETGHIYIADRFNNRVQVFSF